jgi:hypothetical protein
MTQEPEDSGQKVQPKQPSAEYFDKPVSGLAPVFSVHQWLEHGLSVAVLQLQPHI